MRILYVAEIVGKPGLHCVKTALGTVRKERGVDFVIANGDSVTGGFGLGKNHSIQLRKLGVDVITGGDQFFYKKDMAEHIEGAHYLLRAANLPPEMPGRGWRHYTVRPAEWADLPTGTPETLPDPTEGAADVAVTVGAPPTGDGTAQSTTPGLQVAVISLLGQAGFDRIHGGNPFHFLSGVVDRLRRNAGIIILDFHATTTAEKYTMFHHADGMVTAVIGSGQRVQTADAHVMPSGTAVICDAGRTGSRGSVGGFAPEQEIRKYMTGIPVKSEECWADLQLQGALLEVDPGTGYVTSFEALQIPCTAPASPPPAPTSTPRPPASPGKKAGRERS